MKIMTMAGTVATCFIMLGVQADNFFSKALSAHEKLRQRSTNAGRPIGSAKALGPKSDGGGMVSWDAVVSFGDKLVWTLDDESVKNNYLALGDKFRGKSVPKSKALEICSDLVKHETDVGLETLKCLIGLRYGCNEILGDMSLRKKAVDRVFALLGEDKAGDYLNGAEGITGEIDEYIKTKCLGGNAGKQFPEFTGICGLALGAEMDVSSLKYDAFKHEFTGVIKPPKQVAKFDKCVVYVTAKTHRLYKIETTSDDKEITNDPRFTFDTGTASATPQIVNMIKKKYGVRAEYSSNSGFVNMMGCPFQWQMHFPKDRVQIVCRNSSLGYMGNTAAIVAIDEGVEKERESEGKLYENELKEAEQKKGAAAAAADADAL